MSRMEVKSARVVLAVLFLVGSLAMAGCGGSAPKAKGLPPSNDPVLDSGRALLEVKCKMCHPLDRVGNADHDAAGWDATVARMREKNGAVLTDDEAKLILDYLKSR